MRLAILDVGRVGPENGRHFSKITLATNEDRAIDLSCRACGAGAWALGLDSRWGPPLRSVLHPQPPTTLKILQEHETSRSLVATNRFAHHPCLRPRYDAHRSENSTSPFSPGKLEEECPSWQTGSQEQRAKLTNPCEIPM